MNLNNGMYFVLSYTEQTDNQLQIINLLVFFESKYYCL